MRAALPLAVAIALLGFVSAGSPPPVTQSQSLASEPELRDRLQQSRAVLATHGRDARIRGLSVRELIARLDADLAALGVAGTQSPDPDQAAVNLQATLDNSLIDQLVGDASPPPMASGVSEMLMPSGSSGAVQPLALYVPAAAARAHMAPLIMMLPGQGQSETNLLSTPYLRALADETGAVFAALSPHIVESPSDVRPADVYDSLDSLEGSLHIDRRRVYLAGYSMGAFGMFMIAPQQPQTWAALLSVSGTLTNEDKTTVVRALSGKQVFMVVGSDDTVVSASYVRAAVAYLSGNGVDARYDEQPHGTHELSSLRPAVERAWRTMFSGVRNVAPNFELPSPEPTRTIHM